eukprot:TRINITY_DN48130_c0_g1_i1.p1 TRINITY_DN48130_c0_g1~~TRINITY_DN48130_c0_g1_i1.p1  ORF type:complete len:836 (-),score=185.22 TRINITY_DN48130_c0_g1_i1:45-2552(-)
MRILIKGGIWKNSEDEVLKAAVMKYGLNNWSRVASLLARKSPKQCKARWYEWLDPTVKKTEWTREEEEKLLHLAKLFPTQWRTIAPIVGRTAYQCLEHYEKLLDQAQGRDEMDENDPRRLKPGEIDPHPETKPARADPIDMDEDEKEMLSEARARLANTRGKKAKRKAREKQLEEARRLAALQKRRELKAAGISTMKKYRSRKHIDYSEEVPFEAVPPIGFHATGPEETPKVTLGLANMNLQAVEDRNRQAEEERMRKDDARKIKRLKQDNLPQAIEIINTMNDPAQLRKRTALKLPAPQLNDEELEQIVKMGADAAALSAQSADTSTAGLVQSYGETPGSTPLRTPRLQNTILLEAQDAVARNTMQTPLYGETNPLLNETDWSGALPTPKTGSITPNLYAQQARGGMTPGGATPGATPGGTPHGTPAHLGNTPLHRGGGGGGGGAGSTPGPHGTPGTPRVAGTPGALRDGFSLNNGEEELETQQPAKLKEQRQQMQVRAQLQGLPAPMNEVEISMPELEEDEPAGERPLEEDAADADKRRERLEQERVEAERQKRSKAVKRGLPRPAIPETMLFPSCFGPGSDGQGTISGVSNSIRGPSDGGTADSGSVAVVGSLLQQAETLLHDEMAALVNRDAFLFPVKGAKPPQKPVDLPDISLAELGRASDLLAGEVVKFDAAAGGAVINSGALQAAIEQGLGHLTYLPEARRYVEWQMLGRADRLEAAKHMFESAEGAIQRDSKRAKKLEDKMERVLGGFMLKARQSTKKIASLSEERETIAVETEVFKTLAAREEKAICTRVDDLREALDKEKQRNAKLQHRHKDLKRLMKLLDERLQ